MTHSPDSALTIRDAGEHDLEAIRQIYNASIPSGMATADLTPQTLEARKAWWRDRELQRRPVMVATSDAGTVIAWGSFSDFKPRAAYAPCAEISVYVAPSAAGRGVGRRMLDALLARAPGCGIDRILAICFAHNEPSLRLFRSRGFQPWGQLPEACDMHGTRRSVTILGLAVGG